MLRTLTSSKASGRSSRPAQTRQRRGHADDATTKGAAGSAAKPAVRTQAPGSTRLTDHVAAPRLHLPVPAGIAQPRFVDMDQVRRRYMPATWDRISLADPLLMSFQARGIGRFLRLAGAGNLNTAVDTVVNAKRLMLCTGFNVDRNMPETDGPVGVAILAYACCRAGKQVVIVADELNAHLLREALLILDPGCLQQITIESVSAKPDAMQTLPAILARHEIDAMVHTEVPGRNKDGAYLNMRGIPISDFNAPLDTLVNLANDRLMDTVGVGDGGNEAGMGGLSGVPAALNGLDMQAVVPAAHQVIAWNSNLGAIALGEFILAAAGKGASCTPAAFESMVRKMFSEGAVDGVTRKAMLDERIENPSLPRHYNYSCVDGVRSAVHIGNLLQLQDIAHNVPLDWTGHDNKNL